MREKRQVLCLSPKKKKKICRWGGEKFLQACFLGQEELPRPLNPEFCGFVFWYFRHKVKGTKCCVRKKENGLRETEDSAYRLYIDVGSSYEGKVERLIMNIEYMVLSQDWLDPSSGWELGLCTQHPTDFGQASPDGVGLSSLTEWDKVLFLIWTHWDARKVVDFLCPTLLDYYFNQANS